MHLPELKFLAYIHIRRNTMPGPAPSGQESFAAAAWSMEKGKCSVILPPAMSSLSAHWGSRSLLRAHSFAFKKIDVVLKGKKGNPLLKTSFTVWRVKLLHTWKTSDWRFDLQTKICFNTDISFINRGVLYVQLSFKTYCHANNLNFLTAVTNSNRKARH